MSRMAPILLDRSIAADHAYPHDFPKSQLVNHAGRLLGFEVEFGRFQGVQNEIGHDGLWKSPSTGFFIVPEVKTTDAYTVKTSTLDGYINELITEKKIPDRDQALGLYLVGRPDASFSQMTNAIIAEKRVAQLRVASIEALLTLGELMERFDVTHKDVLAVLRPAGPSIDDMARLFGRVTSQRDPTAPESEAVTPEVGVRPDVSRAEATLYVMTPVSDDTDVSAGKTIRSLLDQKVYVFGDRTPGRKNIKAGDRVCFYQSQVGVVAEATVINNPERKKVKFAKDPERFPWAFGVKDVRYFFDKPVVIDAALRGRLDAFRGRDPNKAWAWLVQGTKLLTAHDFEVLVGRA
jgi:hypothetical protein